jgi:predicted dehydrogenase
MQNRQLQGALIGLGPQGSRYNVLVKQSGKAAIAAYVQSKCGHEATELDKAAGFRESEELFHAIKQGALDIDFLILARPPLYRADILDRASNNQLPVFLEVPLAKNMDQALRVADRCTDLPCVVNEQWLRFPNVLALKTILPLFGKIKMIKMRGKGRPWQTELPRIGCHLLAIAHQFAGPASAVSSKEVDSNVLCRVDTSAGPAMEFKFDRPYGVNRCYIEFECEYGRIRLSGSLLQFVDRGFQGKIFERIYLGSYFDSVAISSPEDEDKYLRNRATNPTADLFTQFLECVEAKRAGRYLPNPSPPAYCLEAVRTADMIKSAILDKRVVFP